MPACQAGGESSILSTRTRFRCNNRSVRLLGNRELLHRSPKCLLGFASIFSWPTGLQSGTGTMGIRSTGLHFDRKSKALTSVVSRACKGATPRLLHATLGSTPRVPTSSRSTPRDLTCDIQVRVLSLDRKAPRWRNWQTHLSEKQASQLNQVSHLERGRSLRRCQSRR